MYAITLEWTAAGKAFARTEAIQTMKTLGRAADCTFSIADASLSRLQAEITAGTGGVRIKNVSDSVNIKIGTQSYGTNSEAPLTNKLNFQIGSVPFYCLVATFPDGSGLTATCTICSRPIVPETATCPWCGNDQETDKGGFTMA